MQTPDVLVFSLVVLVKKEDINLNGTRQAGLHLCLVCLGLTLGGCCCFDVESDWSGKVRERVSWLLACLLCPLNKVLKLDLDILGLAEVKGHAVRFIKHRWASLLQQQEHGHLFANNEAYLSGHGPCHWHGQTCAVAPVAVDIVVGGLPCKAFSALREKQGHTLATGPQTKHPSYAPVSDFILYLKARQPGTFWIEEVEAFGHIDKNLRDADSGLLQSHLQVWAHHVARLGYSVRVMRWQHSLWVNNRRTRLLIFGAADKHGGKEAVKWMVQAAQDVIQFRSMQKAVDIWSLVDNHAPDEVEARRRDVVGKRKQVLASVCVVGRSLELGVEWSWTKQKKSQRRLLMCCCGPVPIARRKSARYPRDLSQLSCCLEGKSEMAFVCPTTTFLSVWSCVGSSLVSRLLAGIVASSVDYGGWLTC